jgi:hypothetical protein
MANNLKSLSTADVDDLFLTICSGYLTLLPHVSPARFMFGSVFYASHGKDPYSFFHTFSSYSKLILLVRLFAGGSEHTVQ